MTVQHYLGEKILDCKKLFLELVYVPGTFCTALMHEVVILFTLNALTYVNKINNMYDQKQHDAILCFLLRYSLDT